jgi:hypothetical protein
VTCAAPDCGRSLPPGRRRFCSDLCRVRGRRHERRYETPEFGRMITRMIANMAGRVGHGDPAAFGVLWEVRAEADRACTEAIDGLRGEGFSWAAIAREAGLTRQGLAQWRRRRPVDSSVNDPLRRAAP